jgi:hypothetical protein
VTEKKLGKISKAEYGFCGYQDAMLGLNVTISGDGWGVGADKPGAWTTAITDSTQWTEDDRIKGLGKNGMEILKLLEDAKVQYVSKLIGIPVECTFDGNSLVSWRILKEVL